jgi:hypothetical protein
MSEPSPTYPGGRMIRLADPLAPEVRLIEGDPANDSIEPFLLPSFPLSQEGWLIGLAHHFYKFHRHGLAVLLLMDVTSQRWIKPLIPTQRCTLEGASFRVLAEDLDEVRPFVRIAGSFLWSAALDENEAESMVPPFDGLHLIYWPRGKTLSRHLFLRVEGVIQSIDPATLIFDDWEAYLENHRHLLLMH